MDGKLHLETDYSQFFTKKTLEVFERLFIFCKLFVFTPSGMERYPRNHLMYFRQLWEFKDQSSLRSSSQTATQQILQQIDLSELSQVQGGFAKQS